MQVLKPRIKGYLAIVPADSDGHFRDGILLNPQRTQVVGAVSFVRLDQSGRSVDPANIIGSYNHGVVAVKAPLSKPVPLDDYARKKGLNEEVKRALTHLSWGKNVRRGGSPKRSRHSHHTHS